MGLSLVDLEGAKLLAAERNGADWLLRLDSQMFSEDWPESKPVKVGFRLRGVELRQGEFKALPKEISEFDLRCDDLLWAVHLPPDFRHAGPMQMSLKFADGQVVSLSATEAAMAVAL
jgi:hypothetical protein